jgi:hypothetical protein
VEGGRKTCSDWAAVIGGLRRSRLGSEVSDLRPIRWTVALTALIVFVSTSSSLRAQAVPPSQLPVAATSELFALPTEPFDSCDSYRPNDRSGAAPGSLMYEFIFGAAIVPTREIHVEVDSLGALTSVAELRFVGDLNAGGRMLSAAAVFGAQKAKGMFIESAQGGGVSTTDAGRAAATARDLTAAELERGRALGLLMLSVACKT